MFILQILSVLFCLNILECLMLALKLRSILYYNLCKLGILLGKSHLYKLKVVCLLFGNLRCFPDDACTLSYCSGQRGYLYLLGAHCNLLRKRASQPWFWRHQSTQNSPSFNHSKIPINSFHENHVMETTSITMYAYIIVNGIIAK